MSVGPQWIFMVVMSFDSMSTYQKNTIQITRCPVLKKRKKKKRMKVHFDKAVALEVAKAWPGQSEHRSYQKCVAFWKSVGKNYNEPKRRKELSIPVGACGNKSAKSVNYEFLWKRKFRDVELHLVGMNYK